MFVLIFLAVIALIYSYALCKAVDKGKGQAERDFKMIYAYKAYKEYRQRFANDRNISIEEATDYQAVKNYKEWLEEEYNVKIAEGGVYDAR